MCLRSTGLLYKFPTSCHIPHILKRMKSQSSSLSFINARYISTTKQSFTQENSNVELPKPSTETSQVLLPFLDYYFFSLESVVWTIPNMLCGMRIVAAPILGYCIIDHSYMLSIGILTVAGLTDLADGYIARNFKGQSSKLGTFLDPLADKILIMTLYCSLVYVELIPVLLMQLIVFRDVLLLLAGMYIRYLSLTPPRTVKKYLDGSSSRAELHPTYLSKVNTVLQITIAVISLYAPTTTWLTHEILSFLWYTAGFSTIISGLSYVFSKNTFVIFRHTSKGLR